MSAFQVDINDGIAVVTFDLPNQPVNVLNREARSEFEMLFSELKADEWVRALVLRSGKPANFIAGADIEEFASIQTQEAAEALSRDGQEMINRVASSPKPIIVAIHGTCLGGGLELALACHYRIATDDPKTQLGLPEVQLGLIPGAGGCQRLPRLIGARAALDMILTGRSVSASKARRLGIVDEVTQPAIINAIAIQAARRLIDRGVQRRRRSGGAMGWLLDGNPLGRRIVYAGARRQVEKKSRGQYPAPLAAIDAVRTGLERGMTTGFSVEHTQFGELAVGDVSRKLVQIFFAATALKKDEGVPPGSATPRPIGLLGVIGSGFMGAAIAGTAVTKAGIEVRLKDTELARVAGGLRAARAMLDKRLKRRRITKFEHARLEALLSGTATLDGFRQADLVIEAVFEDLDVKRKVLAEVETTVSGDAIFATNTSTIPISDIAAESNHPERVLGMHFFSPVEKMPLLEVIPGEGTSSEAVVTAVAFGKQMGKTVIVVRDRPGFWVNRILAPYLNEAGHLLAEGTPIDAIDRAMTRFGFPVGPLALLDEVGLDVAQKGGQVMYQAFSERLRPADVIGKLVADKRQGRKNGRGFYTYRKGHKQDPDQSVYALLGVRAADAVSPETIEQRLVYCLLNEAAMACAEGAVRSARDGDIGAIFGIGFPPFRGGPLRMIDDLGASKVVAILRALEAEFGPRFTPAEGLVEMATQEARYYPTGD
jgi:3-hydroxyacyl-CoA dehydrogenase/enoyl-CoA hydratase/3-hydroxybutyryl-CoA epimerase